MTIIPGTTRDTLFNGRLICHQYREGYRFSVDALLAARFCRLGKGRGKILDLGCGSGIIGLVLALLDPESQVVGIDVQEDLVVLARENVRSNSLEKQMTILRADVRNIQDALPPESFDLVVCNPPYGKQGSGRISAADQAAIARHEIKATLGDMIWAAAYCVKNRCPVVFIYPAPRFGAIAAALSEKRLVLRRMQPVYSYPGEDPARLVLLEAVKNGGQECRILPPMYIYAEKNGPYSAAMQQLHDLPDPYCRGRY